MLVRHHVIISLSGGVIVYTMTQSFLKALAFILPGIFIDVDHFFDYIRNYGWKVVKFREFYNVFYNRRLNKIYVFLHGYEMLLCLGIAVWHLKSGLGLIIFLSLATHLFMDQIYYLTHFKECSPWFYFLSYRMSKKFDTRKFNIKL